MADSEIALEDSGFWQFYLAKSYDVISLRSGRGRSGSTCASARGQGTVTKMHQAVRGV